MKNQTGMLKFVNAINIFLALFLIVLWANVFFIHGSVGAISWTLVKLVFAPLGIVLATLLLIFLGIRLVKRKRLMPWLITFVLLLIYASPILMLVDVLPMAYPINIAQTSPAITIHSPFREPVLVGWGGDDLQGNQPHAIWASERWAYDLVKKPANTGSSQLEDYGIYGQDLYSPVAGLVTAAFDDEEDIEPNAEAFLSLAGNYVYIKIDETETYLLLIHLKQNSVVVEVGDRVKVGDFIGQIGNSGTTSEPHLHIHHQRQNPQSIPFPTFAEGLPLYFFDANGGAWMPKNGQILVGQ